MLEIGGALPLPGCTGISKLNKAMNLQYNPAIQDHRPSSDLPDTVPQERCSGHQIGLRNDPAGEYSSLILNNLSVKPLVCGINWKLTLPRRTRNGDTVGGGLPTESSPQMEIYGHIHVAMVIISRSGLMSMNTIGIQGILWRLAPKKDKTLF